MSVKIMKPTLLATPFAQWAHLRDGRATENETFVIFPEQEMKF